MGSPGLPSGLTHLLGLLIGLALLGCSWALGGNSDRHCTMLSMMPASTAHYQSLYSVPPPPPPPPPPYILWPP
ncbi:hypothetical protein SDJN02_06456, partial [Cucurbita argyrosperma subsp. argyrosperma]